MTESDRHDALGDRAVPEGAIQVFGGIGYTWEHDAHLHFRKAGALRAWAEPAGTASTRVAGRIGTLAAGLQSHRPDLLDRWDAAHN